MTKVVVQGGDLRILGELDARSAPILSGALDAVVTPSTTRVHVDVAGVRRVDHDGLSPLLELVHRGHSVVLAGAPAQLRALLELQDVQSAFEVGPVEGSATNP